MGSAHSSLSFIRHKQQVFMAGLNCYHVLSYIYFYIVFCNKVRRLPFGVLFVYQNFFEYEGFGKHKCYLL